MHQKHLKVQQVENLKSRKRATFLEAALNISINMEAVKFLTFFLALFCSLLPLLVNGGDNIIRPVCKMRGDLYSVSWKKIWNRVSFTIKAKGSGYVGLGFAALNSMENAELIAAWVNEDGSFHLDV